MTKRLFVAIDLPESTKQILVDLDPKIRGARWTEAAQMHLTLGFFGDVPEDVDLALREKLSAIVFGAFFLPVVGVGTFPPKGPPKIIWIGVGRGHWLGAASVASAHYDCALPRCRAAVAAKFSKIECRSRCGNDPR